MTIQPHELKLAAKLLRLVSDQFSNHGCNDFDLVTEGELTPEQAYEANKAYILYNEESPDDYDESELHDSAALGGDSGLMASLAAKLEEEAKTKS